MHIPRQVNRRIFLWSRALVAGVVFVVVSVGTHAETLRELAWDDLLPPALLELEKEAFKLGNRLQRLTRDQKAIYDDVAYELLLRDKLAAGTMKESELSDDERKLVERKPSESHPEVAAFWRKFEDARTSIESQGQSVDAGLNGSRVRIPGYVLPLEFDGTKVREFLLVPYVGACIHTPPPPANQMVFVRAGESFESEGLYAPVWVEGRMLSVGGTHNLSLVDGERPVDAGYTLEADKIVPYEQ